MRQPPPKRRLLTTLAIFLAGVLTGALALAGTAGYLAFARPATNPPAQACPAASPRLPIVVTAGASATQGALGADWVGTLRTQHPAYEFVNAGVNGSTSADLLARIPSITACSPAAVTILIGANDVRNGVPPTTYRTNLEGIVTKLAPSGARIALMSLPPLGEDLTGPMNRKLHEYNAVIRETATRFTLTYLPVNENMTAYLSEHPATRSPYDFSFPLALTAATQHYILGRSWDEIADRAGRQLLVDHIHLTNRAGTIVTALVSSWLST
ncbi:SGNH/GDSL hydrolase family protein [Longispora albida]|uniref:SGNH/GDSL hydrolase family protein n=1 Tax=Longispora albida TaxID=203523 RepID=UPI000371B11B|nr:GDSL-type esterase/lipase family protein [Longispora albida]